ncbi:MAG: thioredoxin family protein [Promethearchaeota archaeon]
MLMGTNRGMVQREFQKLKERVKLLLFTSLTKEGYRQCPACEDTAEFVKELAGLSGGKIVVEEYSTLSSSEVDREMVKKHAVDHVPTIIFDGFGIRYVGAPLGNEAGSFLKTLIMASSGETGVTKPIRFMLRKIKKPKVVRTFVTLTCPYCPHAVLQANRIALASDKVFHEVIEVYEHPDLANKYLGATKGVPTTLIGEEVVLAGVPPVREFLEKLAGWEAVNDTGMYT